MIVNQFDKIRDITKFITNRTPSYNHSMFYQTQDEIRISGEENSGNELMLLHEVGHWVAATEEERLMPNLGFKDDESVLTEWELEREIKAREISRILFWEWGKDKFEDKLGAYLEYLTHDIFKGPNFDKVMDPFELTEDDVDDMLFSTELSVNLIRNKLAS